MTQANQLPLTRYHVTFAISLIFLTVVLGAINYFLEFSTIGVSLVLPFLASTFVGEQFVKRQQRMPNASEKQRLIVGGLTIFAALNFLLLLATWAGGVFAELPSGGAFLVFVITMALMGIAILINYFLMRWAYGSLLMKRAKKLGINSIEDTF